MRRLTLAVFAFALAAAPAFAADKKAAPAKAAPAPAKPATTPGTPVGGPHAHAEIKGADGKVLGSVKLEQLVHGVLITGELSGLPAGTHAIHVHEVGKCEAPFASAGGHFNPEHKKHGLKATEGAHAGDLPSLVVPESGKVSFEIVAHDVSLTDGAGNLFDADGSALVVHKTADDYLTDPAGNAGDRVACGVVTLDK